ncbi:MAG: hypothetical protein P8Y93_02520 [Acidobacteriota bacterium]
MSDTASVSAARTSDHLMILAAALLFSTGGAAVKLCSLNAWQVASLRSGIAAMALLLFLPHRAGAGAGEPGP